MCYFLPLALVYSSEITNLPIQNQTSYLHELKKSLITSSIPPIMLYKKGMSFIWYNIGLDKYYRCKILKLGDKNQGDVC
jgi:hypothetical protein